MRTLIEDLNFPDRLILANAFDAVRRNDKEIQRLWDSLKAKEVERKWDIRPPAGFFDPGRVQMFSSLYPKVAATSLEGKRIWKAQRVLERDRNLVKVVKAGNRATNGGRLVCEACVFSEPSDALFDAHHLDPLACGIRKSRVDDFAILCPTSHRWAHAYGVDRLQPLSMTQLRSARSKAT